MKCVVLAGGMGERLWPLSRKNYPKQFIRIQGNHSLFQETVARNIPYCDEFIIVTGEEHRNVVENQMKAFQGIAYRCVYEGTPRRTTASILLSVMNLQPSEFVFVVSSDHIINSNEKYKEAIIEAKAKALGGKIAVLGLKETAFNSHFGYIDAAEDGSVRTFIEKPDSEKQFDNEIYRNLGMMIFQVGTLINEMRKCQPEMLSCARKAYKKREAGPGYDLYSADILNTIEAISIERALLEKSDSLNMIEANFDWEEITLLEDISKTSYSTNGTVILNECDDVVAVNNSSRQAVVVNKLEDVIVINTDDAVYVGKKGESDALKSIIKEHEELIPYTEKSDLYYRQWGYYIQLSEGIKHHVRMVHVMPGKTIYEHTHRNRTENWTILSGKALAVVGGQRFNCEPGQNIDIWVGCSHQITNIGEEELVFVDTSYGVNLHTEERLPRNPEYRDLNDVDLGFKDNPIIKLSPVFKDNLWGGTDLRERYSMNCDYDYIAEAWVMSAHAAGKSIVASGRHKGVDFARYIDMVGKASLGWKCSPLQAFPLLVKFIDAKENLSVQVHPDDDYALGNENEYGKNEMWYVVDSKPGSGLYLGFKSDVTPEEVKERIANNTILDILNYVETKPGEVYYIPAGTVHAIGAGNLILEIQQSSNVTYRLFDFDRIDKFGNKRDLNVDKAMAVMNYSRYQNEASTDNSGDALVCSCKYFESSVHNVSESKEITLDDSRFAGLVVIDGHGTASIGTYAVDVKAGEAYFIPANGGKLKFEGNMTVLMCGV